MLVICAIIESTNRHCLQNPNVPLFIVMQAQGLPTLARYLVNLSLSGYGPGDLLQGRFAP